MKFESPRGDRKTPELIMEGAIKRANDFLVKTRIDMGDFEDHFGKDQVDKDKEKLRKIIEGFDANNLTREMARVAEAIVGEQGELSNWLGESVEIFNSSEFDDIINGIDLIAEYSIEDIAKAYLGMGIDVVMSANLEAIGDKIENIRMSIERGEGGRVKYFQSSDGNFKGSLSKVPKVVIGFSANTIKDLTDAWMSGGEGKKRLAQHWVQFQILDSILMQLESFYSYARKVGQEDIAENYRRVSNIIVRVREEKQGVLNDSGERDEFFQTLNYLLNKILS